MTKQVERAPHVVVGVDGSANSLAALRWACGYVRLTGGELHAVSAWEGPSGFAFSPVSASDFEKEAAHNLDRALATALGEGHQLDVVRDVVHGNPAEVLIEASKNADLLVVGKRGYGGFAGLLLGSVGENCVRQASCSVIVVREHS